MPDSDKSEPVVPGLYETLVCVDSALSVVVHRYSAGIPADLLAEMDDLSAKCRKLAEQTKPATVNLAGTPFRPGDDVVHARARPIDD